MNTKRAYFYFLYILLLGGIAAKLIGWITLTHNFFFDWVSEGMILLFLILEAPSLFRYLNPGVKIQQALKQEEIHFEAPMKSGWLWTGVLIRLFLAGLAIGLGLIFLYSSRRMEYIWAASSFYLALLFFAGIVSYLRENPYRFLLTDFGLRIYIFSFQELSWEQVKHIIVKARWVVIKPQQGADRDLEFENVATESAPLIGALKTQSLIRNIRYDDNSDEYKVEIWE
jgi:hypothetical protein